MAARTLARGTPSSLRHYTILTRMRPLVASLPMGSTFVEALHVFPSYYKSALKMKQQLLLSLPATFGIRVPPVAGAWYKRMREALPSASAAAASPGCACGSRPPRGRDRTEAGARASRSRGRADAGGTTTMHVALAVAPPCSALYGFNSYVRAGYGLRLRSSPE